MALPRVELLSPSAAKYLQFSKNQFSEIERQRIGSRLPVLKKILKVENYDITIFSSDWNNFIRLEGSLLIPLILFSNGTNGYGYSYLSGKYEKAKITASTNQLNSQFASRCQHGDETFSVVSNGKWATGSIPDNGSFLGYLTAYEMGVFYSGPDIYGRVKDTKSLLFPKPPNLIPSLSGGWGPLFSAVGVASGEDWNQYQNAVAFTYNPILSTVADSWYWVPSFFNVFPGGNSQQLFPGWYYGDQLSPRYGFNVEKLWYEPLTYCEVELKAILDSRTWGSGTNFGWCEFVSKWKTEFDSGEPRDLIFYFSDAPIETLDYGTDYYEVRQFGQHSYIDIGTTMVGKTPSAIIEGQTHEMANPDVKIWSFKSWTDEESIIPQNTNAVGIVVKESQNLKIYRYKEYLADVYSTNNCHSFHIETTGEKIAVFEGSTVIESVKVFDLYGAKEGAGYISGGFTTISPSTDLSSLGMNQGVIIPYRKQSFTPEVFSGSYGNSVSPLKLGFPAMGQIGFWKDGLGPVAFLKLTCSEGTKAVFEQTTDKCFESTIIIDDPDQGVLREKLVGSWNYAGGLKGVVRGTFSGSGDSRRFEGTGRGDIAVITLDKNIHLAWNASFGQHLEITSVTVGDVILDPCFETEEGTNFTVVKQECAESVYCGGSLELFVETTCGQRGTIDYEVDPPDELIVYSAGGGEFYTIGGRGDITWSFSHGTIDNTGTITDYSDCGTVANPKYGTVTAQDECGNSDQISVQLPNGTMQWLGQWDINWSPTEQCNYGTMPVANGTCAATNGSAIQYKNVYSYQYSPTQIRWCATAGICFKVYELVCP